MNPFSHSFLGPVRRFAANWQAWREEVRTENMIDRLPANIRKDIGWPDAKAARRAARFGGWSL
jgi:hypothetical protein